MAKKTTDSAGKATSREVTAMAFLQQPDKHINPETPPNSIAVFGDEPFLRFETLQAIRAVLSSRSESGSQDESGITVYSNGTPDFSTVKLELTTTSMFGPQSRTIVIEQADEFVKSNREKIEDFVTNPEGTGTLVLELTSLASNTRLYKSIAEHGLLLNCKALSTDLLAGWLVKRAAKYKAEIQRDAAEILVDKTGDSMGMLDQELLKLASFANGKPITPEMVDKMSGSWRSQTAWDMLDSAMAGLTDSALMYLDSLLAANEVPIVIVAQLAANLRRLAMANRVFLDARANGRGISINEALRQTGIDKPFILRKSQSQIEKLGIRRATHLLDWLTELDYALKGDSRLDARTLLEQFLMRLSRNA